MLRNAFRRRFGLPGHPKMGSKPREKIVRKTSLVFSHFFFDLGSQKVPFSIFRTPPFSIFFRYFFPPRSRPSPEGAPRPILEQFSSILEQFWVDFLSMFSPSSGKNLAEIWRHSCTKPAEALGNPTRTHKL